VAESGEVPAREHFVEEGLFFLRLLQAVFGPRLLSREHLEAFVQSRALLAK
jgi:hypothetical protein